MIFCVLHISLLRNVVVKVYIVRENLSIK